MIFNSYHIDLVWKWFNTLKYCSYRQIISLSSRRRISEPQSRPSAPVQTVLGFRAHHFECYQHWSVSHSNASHQLRDRWCLSNCPVIQPHLCGSSSPEYGHLSLVIKPYSSLTVTSLLVILHSKYLWGKTHHYLKFYIVSVIRFFFWQFLKNLKKGLNEGTKWRQL